MRICLVNTYHYRRGGDSTYTFDLADLLRVKGHEVVHFAMKHPSNLESEFASYFPEHVDYRLLHQRAGPANKLRFFFRSLYSYEVKAKFERLLDDANPDVVHLQNFRRHLTFSVVSAARSRRKPLVLTAHDYDAICPNSLLFAGDRICEACGGRSYYKAALRRCKEGSLAGSLAVAFEGYFVRLMRYYRAIDMIVTPSAFLKDCLGRRGFAAQRLRAVPNFIDGSRYRPSTVSEGYAIYFGRLSKEKGVDILLRAFGRISGLRLLIAGDGPERRPLEELASNAGIRSAEFIGYVDRERLLEIVGRAMFVVVPSVWLENFPYSILEAFALGKPVVASNVGGIPEMVEDEQTGLLFSPGDWTALAERISSLQSNPQAVRDMGERARKRVETEFDADTHYRRLKQIYDGVLGKGDAA